MKNAASARRLVRQRASERCEYCDLAQSSFPLDPSVGARHTPVQAYTGSEIAGQAQRPKTIGLFRRDEYSPCVVDARARLSGSRNPMYVNCRRVEQAAKFTLPTNRYPQSPPHVWPNCGNCTSRIEIPSVQPILGRSIARIKTRTLPLVCAQRKN